MVNAGDRLRQSGVSDFGFFSSWGKRQLEMEPGRRIVSNGNLSS
jgi:hypothetical protein